MKLSPKEILKPALALLIICVAATALLALTNSVTAARIAETERENAIAARGCWVKNVCKSINTS